MLSAINAFELKSKVSESGFFFFPFVHCSSWWESESYHPTIFWQDCDCTWCVFASDVRCIAYWRSKSCIPVRLEVMDDYSMLPCCYVNRFLCNSIHQVSSQLLIQSGGGPSIYLTLKSSWRSPCISRLPLSMMEPTSVCFMHAHSQFARVNGPCSACLS